MFQELKIRPLKDIKKSPLELRLDGQIIMQATLQHDFKSFHRPNFLIQRERTNISLHLNPVRQTLFAK